MTARKFSTAFFSLVAALLTTAGLTLVMALPAQAHSQLISSSPADGDQADEPPQAVTLEFNENIQEIGNEIVVTGPDGSDVVDGEPQIDGPVVTQAIAATGEGAVGTYTVTWRVVSADGHPISGEFTFEVLQSTVSDEPTEDATTEDATTDATEATSETTPEASSSAEAETIDSGPDLAVPIIIAVVVIAAAVAAALVIRKKRAR